VLLSEAIDNLLEAARIVSREKALAPIMKTLEPQVAKIFRKQGKLFLPQFAKLKSQFTEALDEARLKRILDRIHAETSDEFKATIKASSANAYGAGIEAGSDLGAAISFSLKHPAAVEWLESHAAEAVTGINETTRTVIGDIVKNGVAEGQSYNKVAKAIRDQYEEFAVGKPQAHIQSRAHLVAVTESHTAYGEGHRAGIEPLLKVGLDVEHSWVTMGDDVVSDGCLENENAGWIPYDEPFPSGDLAEPRFPGCRCGVLFQLKPTEGTASD
jgi:hypothetical protein